jgi:endonuclease I
MKKIIALFLLQVFFLGNAQNSTKQYSTNTILSIPAGYYNSATGSGFELKTQLYSIINPHTQIVYSSGLWNLYASSDVRQDGYVWEIYTTCNFIFGTVASGGNQDDGTLGTQECQRFNKEHTFPKSWFGSATGTPMYSDAFHVMPSDKKVNGARGNLAYGIVGTANYTTSNGTKKGNCVAPNYPYSLQVFEPADEFKGDIARNYFYMATCYENLIGSWQTLDPNGDTILDGSNDKVFEQWYLEMLYNWHVNDPVSQKEIDRNNAIYPVQGNRNPFIDHPEYVFQIWGDYLGQTAFTPLQGVSFYPNPTNTGSVTITSSILIDELDLITLNGQVFQKILHPTFMNNGYTLSNLPKGFYFIKLHANHETVTKKIIVN